MKNALTVLRIVGFARSPALDFAHYQTDRNCSKTTWVFLLR